MKTRILTLLLAFLCLTALAACGKADTPYSLYNGAVKELNGDNRSFRAEVTMLITTQSPGSKTTDEISATLGVSGEDFSVTSEDHSLIYVDGHAYVSKENQPKYKINMNRTDAINEAGFNPDATIPVLPKTSWADAKWSKDGDLRTVWLPITEENLRVAAAALLALEEKDLESTTIEQVTATITFDEKDRPVQLQTTIVMVENEQASVTAEITYRFLSVGNKDAVKLPEDAEEYEDYSGLIGG